MTICSQWFGSCLSFRSISGVTERKGSMFVGVKFSCERASKVLQCLKHCNVKYISLPHQASMVQASFWLQDPWLPFWSLHCLVLNTVFGLVKMASPAPLSWLHSIQQEGHGDKGKYVPPMKETCWKLQVSICLHLTGPKLITWTHLTEEKDMKIGFLFQVAIC